MMRNGRLATYGDIYGDIFEENEDVQISFMHHHGSARSCHWSEREDICYVPLQCVLCPVDALNTTNGQQYCLDKRTMPVHCIINLT